MRLNNPDCPTLERKVQAPDGRATVNLSIYSRPPPEYRAEFQQKTRVNSGSEIGASIALPFFGKLSFDSPQKIARFVKVVRNGTRQSFGIVGKNGACVLLISSSASLGEWERRVIHTRRSLVSYANARRTSAPTFVYVQNETAALLRNSENIGNACRNNQLHYWIFMDFQGLSQWNEIE